MEPAFGDALLLLAGGLVAGVVNTLAGGGSLLTVPLLHFVGLPGTLANGTNRVGVLMQCATAAWRFRREGQPSFREVAPLLGPVVCGALLGAYGVARVPDAFFERAFGVVMLVLLVPMLRPQKEAADARENSAPAAAPASATEARPHAAAAPRAKNFDAPAQRIPVALRVPLFFAIGVYGGAVQAGVGLLLIAVIRWSGMDLLRTNSMKVAINFCFTLLVLPIFVFAGQIEWRYALLLGAGFAAGGELGARLALRGGEKLLRPVVACAVLLLSGRMLGLY